MGLFRNTLNLKLINLCKMGECCSTSKLAIEESQNQVELFEVVPINSQSRGLEPGSSMEKTGGRRA